MRIITGKALSRRTFLCGTGAMLGLPYLDAMSPALAAAAQSAHRFQAVYVPNGMAMEYWSPKGEGRDFELSPILEPFAPFRNQMLVLSGIDASWNQVHAGASGSFLTGVTHGGRNESEIVDDVSVDQLLARQSVARRRWHRSSSRWIPPNNAGSCSASLSCVYTHTISWA